MKQNNSLSIFIQNDLPEIMHGLMKGMSFINMTDKLEELTQCSKILKFTFLLTVNFDCSNVDV